MKYEEDQQKTHIYDPDNATGVDAIPGYRFGCRPCERIQPTQNL